MLSYYVSTYNNIHFIHRNTCSCVTVAEKKPFARGELECCLLKYDSQLSGTDCFEHSITKENILRKPSWFPTVKNGKRFINDFVNKKSV